MTHPAPAYFLSLSLENVRCFGPEQLLDLTDGEGRPSQWTIILGDNGTGKTTLLQSLAVMATLTFGPDPSSRYPWQVGFLGRVSRDEGVCKIKTRISMSPELKRADGTPVEYSLNTNGTGSLVFTTHQELGADHLADSVGTTSPNILCLGYGASRRMAPSALSELVPWLGMIETLFNADVPLPNSEEWLLRMDYLDARSKNSTAGQRNLFNHVRDILTEALPDVSDLRVAGLEQGRHPELFIEARTPYGWVRLRELSLGYQSMMAWIADLVRRLDEAEPNGANKPLHGPAVVLIDEIDLHLHPSWQRKLMGYLSERFPNVQFIATAHSPLIVQAAADANLVVLRREGDHVVIDNNPGSVYG